VWLPEPFQIDVLLDALAARRGRPIELLPVRARHDIPCGLLVSTDRADYIVYSADTSALHQQHILLHEAAHILCGHQDACHSTISTGTAATAAALVPRLDPGLVRRVLGRTIYTEPQEQEAELVASLILSRATRHPSRPAGQEQSGLDSLFGAVVRPGGPRV
jgi:hypothetical protein